MPTIDYICVGFPKCGTTAIWENLQRHPKIHVLKRNDREAHKNHEIYFFNQNPIFKRGLKWYESLMISDKINFEKTPAYIFNLKALRRIKENYSNVALIICLRNPIDYLQSFYHHRRIEYLLNPNDSSKITGSSFWEFIHKPCPETNNEFTYLQSARYIRYIRKIFSLFDNSKIKIIFNEKLIKMKNMNELNSILGLPKISKENEKLTKYKHSYSSDDKLNKLANEIERYEINDIERIKLNKYFQSHNQKLFKFLQNNGVKVNNLIWS